MTNRISLLEEISTGRYDASVITTFSVYFPFYETVILPKLIATGCRHNVLLVDANECAKALEDEASRPRLAGREYALLPIRAGGAFHPKILLLVGPKSGKVFVGSHNLTISGFGQNRKITTYFDVGAQSGRDSTEYARQVWSLVREWVAGTPADARACVGDLPRLAPWLSRPSPQSKEAPVLVGTRTIGPNLWSQVLPYVPRPVRRVLVLGAFFDKSLGFLKTIARELRPKDFVVAIDPESVEITHKAPSVLPGGRFVDASDLGDKTGYLHAKALVVQGVRGDELFVTGSANPSAPAWLSGADTRNVEMVVVQRSERQGSLSRLLGLQALCERSPIEPAVWNEMGRRTTARAQAGNEPGCRVVLAFANAKGFRIPVAELPDSRVREVTRHLDGGKHDVRCEFEVDGKWLQIRVPDRDTQESVTLLDLVHASRELTRGIPYDPMALRGHGQSESHKALQRALDTLETQAPEVEGLIRLVEKVVFDQIPSGGVGRHPQRLREEEQDAGSEEEPGSLATDLSGGTTYRRHRRYLIEDNLALLLDALIHHLGRGLLRGSSGTQAARPGEEEGIGQEGDSFELPPNVDPERLAALCRRKVQTLLLRRLVPRLEMTYAAADSDSLTAVFQTAAVLGVTKALARAERVAPWLPQWERLVDPESLREFLSNSAWDLCVPKAGILERCLNDAKTVGAEEVSISLGLLMWCASFAEIDHLWQPRDEDREEIRDKMLDLASLLWVAVPASRDPKAESYTRGAMNEVCLPSDLPRAHAWCRDTYSWGRKVSSIRRPNRAVLAQRAAKIGDVAWLVTDDGIELLSIVVDAWPGRVVLADPTRDGWVRMLDSNYAKIIDVSRISECQ